MPAIMFLAELFACDFTGKPDCVFAVLLHRTNFLESRRQKLK